MPLFGQSTIRRIGSEGGSRLVRRKRSFVFRVRGIAQRLPSKHQQKDSLESQCGAPNSSSSSASPLNDADTGLQYRCDDWDYLLRLVVAVLFQPHKSYAQSSPSSTRDIVRGRPVFLCLVSGDLLQPASFGSTVVPVLCSKRPDGGVGRLNSLNAHRTASSRYRPARPRFSSLGVTDSDSN